MSYPGLFVQSRKYYYRTVVVNVHSGDCGGYQANTGRFQNGSLAGGVDAILLFAQQQYYCQYSSGQ
jgi:hypothetical protein